MGGRSRSEQRTTNNQRTDNFVNDGEFAGASNISIDESDNSVTDSHNTTTEDSYNTTTDIDDAFNTTYDTDIEQDIDNSVTTDIDEETDNSVRDAFNTITEMDQDIDSSVRDAFNTTNEVDQEIDNSVRDAFNTTSTTEIDESQQYDDSFNTDNSVSIENEGEFSGNQGSIVFTDQGAVSRLSDVSRAALAASVENNDILAETVGDVVINALNANSDVTQDAFDITGQVIETLADNTLESGEMLSGAFVDATHTIVQGTNDNADIFVSGANQTVSDALNFGRDAINAVAMVNVDTGEQFRQTNQAVIDGANQTLVDAFSFAGDISDDYLQSVSENQAALFSATGEALSFGNMAIDTVSANVDKFTDSLLEQANTNASNLAVLTDEALDFSGDVLGGLQEEAQAFRDSLTDQADIFASNVAQLSAANSQSNFAAIEAISDAATQDRAVISELAESTSFGGQTVIAQTSQRIVMYVAIALTVAGAAAALRGK